MSVFPPPTEIVPIFNPLDYLRQDSTLTKEYADLHYLQFPVAQGTESLQETIVNGPAVFNDSLTANNNIVIDGIPNTNYLEFPDGSKQYTAPPAGNLLTSNNIFTGTNAFNNAAPITSTATQPAFNDSSTKIPTTAWVQSAITSVGTPTLSSVLTAGNSAGTTSLNMNNQNITGVNTLSFASTSQTSAYTGGAAGTYTNVGMTLDANGKISSIASGTLSPTVVKRAYAYGNNITASLIQFNINIPLSGSSFTPRNQFVSFRLTFNQEAYISGGVNQSFMTTSCILNLYPGRFTAGWLTQNAGAILDEYSRGMISDNTIYATSSTANFVVNDATYCPLGRQFWCTDLSYTAGGSPTIGTRLNISGGAGTNQVYIYVLNPAGYPSAAIPQNFSLSLELLNTSGSSGITTTGFAAYGGVDF